MRWPSRSSSPWRTLPASRASSSAAVSRGIRLSRRSAALSSTAPPSELALGTSNRAVRGFPKRSENSRQSVVVGCGTRRPPSVEEVGVDNHFLPHGGLRVPYVSRIIRAKSLRGFGVQEDQAL